MLFQDFPKTGKIKRLVVLEKDQIEIKFTKSQLKVMQLQHGLGLFLTQFVDVSIQRPVLFPEPDCSPPAPKSVHIVYPNSVSPVLGGSGSTNISTHAVI